MNSLPGFLRTTGLGIELGREAECLDAAAFAELEHPLMREAHGLGAN
jgi:hypothetical protein